MAQVSVRNVLDVKLADDVACVSQLSVNFEFSRRQLWTTKVQVSSSSRSRLPLTDSLDCHEREQ